MGAQTIRFDHVGEQDKPMPLFNVSPAESRTFNPMTRFEYIITADKRTFEELASYISINKPAYSKFKGKPGNFGTYRIVLARNEENGLEYFLEIDEAKPFFTEMLPLIKNDTEFYKSIEVLLKRLG